MARKGKRQKITRLKVSSSASKNRTQDTISRLVRLSKLSSRSLSARDRAFHVPADMRRDPNLTFTQAAANRGVDRYTVHKYVDAALRTDSSGKIKARPTDHLCETLYIPGTKPDKSIPIRTKSNKERQLVGQWHTAKNAAANGDFSLIRAFPKNTFVGGVRLPTSPFEIQKILTAEAEAETKLEGPYRTLARPA